MRSIVTIFETTIENTIVVADLLTLVSSWRKLCVLVYLLRFVERPVPLFVI